MRAGLRVAASMSRLSPGGGPQGLHLRPPLPLAGGHRPADPSAGHAGQRHPAAAGGRPSGRAAAARASPFLLLHRLRQSLLGRLPPGPSHQQLPRSPGGCPLPSQRPLLREGPRLPGVKVQKLHRWWLWAPSSGLRSRHTLHSPSPRSLRAGPRWLPKPAEAQWVGGWGPPTVLWPFPSPPPAGTPQDDGQGPRPPGQDLACFPPAKPAMGLPWDIRLQRAQEVVLGDRQAPAQPGHDPAWPQPPGWAAPAQVFAM